MKSIIIKLIISLGLLSLWVFLNLKYISQYNYGLLSLVSLSKFKSLSFSRSPQLLKGDMARDVFTSKYPKLGIISVRFLNHNQSKPDKLEFRLKEEKATDWYYRAVYNTDQFQPGQLFPFGFPPIEDSAGKKYIFEIESLFGTADDNISIDTAFPAYVNHHVYSKKDLLNSFGEAIHFLEMKLVVLVTQPIFLYQSLIFAIPPIFYLIMVFFRVNYKVPLVLLFFLIASEIKTHTVFPDYMYATAAFIWMAIFFKYHKDSDILKPQIIFLFLLMMLSAMVNKFAVAEEAAIWLYLSIAVGLLHFMINKLRSNK